MPKPSPHRRPFDNHFAIDQDLHRRSAPVDILASYQNKPHTGTRGRRGYSTASIDMHNIDSGGRDGGDGDPGEYFSALLDRALCQHEVKLVG